MWLVQDRRETNITGKQMLERKMDKEMHPEMYGGSREGKETKRCWNGPIHYAGKLKLRFRVGD